MATAVALILVALGVSAQSRDVNGRPIAPFTPAGKANVVFFVQTDCPISNRYAPEIQRLASRFASQVRFRLVYPVPEPGGLGVHVTLDLAGQARFGPDVEWIERIGKENDYGVDPKRAERFYAAIRRYWPGLADGALAPGYAGIRPKTAGPGAPAPDFEVQGPRAHGVPGLVNLFGIESPGLTASLALAQEVTRQLS